MSSAEARYEQWCIEREEERWSRSYLKKDPATWKAKPAFTLVIDGETFHCPKERPPRWFRQRVWDVQSVNLDRGLPRPRARAARSRRTRTTRSSSSSDDPGEDGPADGGHLANRNFAGKLAASGSAKRGADSLRHEGKQQQIAASSVASSWGRRSAVLTQGASA